MKTNQQINYRTHYGDHVIPKGTQVTPAEDLHEDGFFWVEAWEGMSGLKACYQRNYGYLIPECKVEV